LVRTSHERHRELDPDTPVAPTQEVASKQLRRVADLAIATRATLSALIGERGSGKSTFLSRLADTIGPQRVHVVQCPQAGFEALQAELAGLAGNPTLRGPALCKTLRGLDASVIAIDDLQRLVVVNGLADLDAFMSFDREVGGALSWVVTWDVTIPA
jgi:ABC-type branched-subunit amino acid transport system ATPase component